MCLICVQYEAGKMTKEERTRALTEMMVLKEEGLETMDDVDDELLHIWDVLTEIEEED